MQEVFFEIIDRLIFSLKTFLFNHFLDIFILFGHIKNGDKMQRTDLVCEDAAKENIVEDRIKSGTSTVSKIVLDEQQAKKYHKKAGTYYTIYSDAVLKIEHKRFEDLYKALAKIIKDFLKLYSIKKDDPVFIVGLGNYEVTPDSLGPKVIDMLLVTRHLAKMGKLEEDMQNVLALAPGVMAQTGVESVDICKAIVDKVKPKLVIVVDALASRSLERLNQTIQITDTSIRPGSGVGNNRKEFSKDTLGVPVLCIGVPTVVDIRSYVEELMEKFQTKDVSPVITENEDIQFMVTPKEIDQNIIDLSHVISDGLNLALHHR